MTIRVTHFLLNLLFSVLSYSLLLQRRSLLFYNKTDCHLSTLSVDNIIICYYVLYYLIYPYCWESFIVDSLGHFQVCNYTMLNGEKMGILLYKEIWQYLTKLHMYFLRYRISILCNLFYKFLTHKTSPCSILCYCKILIGFGSNIPKTISLFKWTIVYLWNIVPSSHTR